MVNHHGSYGYCYSIKKVSINDQGKEVINYQGKHQNSLRIKIK